jgi:hypothetical protein
VSSKASSSIQKLHVKHRMRRDMALRRMRRSRFKACVLVVLVGCASVAAVEFTESALEDGQGSDLQGSDLQGSDLQGSDLQGTRYDGAEWEYTSLDNVQRATKPMTNVVDPGIDKASLYFWTYVPFMNQWVKSLPNGTCTYNATRTQLISCNTITSFETVASPLAGTRYQARFRDENGVSFDTTIQIGLSTSDKEAVRPDSSSAMFKRTGSPSCTEYAFDQVMFDGTRCKNPGGCERNCDLWQYRVYIIDPTVNGGQPHAVCGNGVAIAVPGSYTFDGYYSPPPQQRFTFSCTGGTIAKCTRWGFRPWGSATKTCQTDCGPADTTEYPLIDLHRSCVRAAMADYCAMGESYTRNGTLVDIWDYEHTKPNAWGFVARTMTTNRGMFQYESTFDRHGGYLLSYTRYDEVYENPAYQGPPIIPCTWRAVCNADGTCDPNPVRERPIPSWDPPSTINIDSGTGCTHSELMPGKWLHANCSACTQALAQDATLAHCFDAKSSGGWGSACTGAAQSRCTAAQRMGSATHSECVSGTQPVLGANGLAGSLCMRKVCDAMPSCCTASFLPTWSSACVTHANDVCYGGGDIGALVPNTGFCGSPRTKPPGNGQ